jgi:hypothetical protein
MNSRLHRVFVIGSGTMGLQLGLPVAAHGRVPPASFLESGPGV